MLTSAHEFEASIDDARLTQGVQERRHAHHLIAKIDKPLRNIDKGVDRYSSDRLIASHVDSLSELLDRMVDETYPMSMGERRVAHELQDDYDELCADLAGQYYDSSRGVESGRRSELTLLSATGSKFSDKQTRRDILALGENITSLVNQVLEQYPCRFRDSSSKRARYDSYDDDDEGYGTDTDRRSLDRAETPVPVSAPVSPPVTPMPTQSVSYVPSTNYPVWGVAGAVPVSTVPAVATTVPTAPTSAATSTPSCQHEHCHHAHCSHQHDEPMTVEVTVNGAHQQI